MTQNLAQGISIAPTARYRLQAYSSALRINLDQLRSVFLAGQVERVGRDCVLIHRFDEEKVFVFSFGAAVFFNVPPAEHEYYLSKLGIATKSSASAPQSYEQITEDHFILKIEPGVTKVSFNSVTLPDLDMGRLQLVTQVLAQSSALELIEREVDEFLAESESMTGLFKISSALPGRRQKLLEFLGEGLRTRHQMVNQLAILKEPDKTWDNQDLYQLYKELFANFEIEDRIEKIERHFQLAGQVTELLLEIVNTRRAEIMEIIIIVLIAVEIIKSFLS